MERKLLTAVVLAAALLGGLAAKAASPSVPGLLHNAAQARAGNPVLVAVPANALSPQGLVLVVQAGDRE